MLSMICKTVLDQCSIKKILRWSLVFGVVFVIFLLTYVSRLNGSAKCTTEPSAILNNSSNKSTPPSKVLELSTKYNIGKFSQQRRCEGHHHVYYLKTHKTGSTTMYSIFAEYSRVHNLLPLLPRGHHINQSPPVRNDQLLLPENIGKFSSLKFDMVFNHHVYSPPIFNHLYNDTIKITTIREPFRHFISSFTYFRREGLPYLKRIPGEDPLLELLKDRNKYEAGGYSSYTNNRQSIDLGFDIRHPFNDTDYISKFIRETEKRFDLVLITDYFHESLVLMKRHLCWSTQDIVYFSKNAQIKNKTEMPKSQSIEKFYKEIHATFSQADTALYLHFCALFKERMKKEEGLDEEVAELEVVLEKVRAYCDSISKTVSKLNIPSGRWSESIDMVPNKCKWLKMPELSFTLFLQKRQKIVLSFE